MKSRFLLSAVLALACLAGARADFVPSDVRVKPFIPTKWDWNGGDVDGAPCYNYYNPVLESTGTNAPVAHAAMALAQILHYYKTQLKMALPDVTPISATCGVDTEVSTQTATAAKKSLEMKWKSDSGYDWNNMPADPSEGLTDEQRQAIGKLTFDTGVALQTAFNAKKSYACSFFIQKVLTGVFGFANVSMLENNGEDDFVHYTYDGVEYTSYGNFEKYVFPNLDAGYPVIMDIRDVSKNESHYIDLMDVALVDGYGYEGETPYVHVVGGPRAGWCEVKGFNNISGLYFNLFPTDADKTILAGRAVSAKGEPVANAGVKIYEEGSLTALETKTTTSDTGVFGIRLPAGKNYEVSFVRDDVPVDHMGPYELQALTTYTPGKVDFSGTCLYMDHGGEDGTWGEPFAVYRTNTRCVWGDINLPSASVRITADGEALLYGTVDTAVTKAKELVKEGATAITLDIMRDAGLTESVTINFPCTITRPSDAETEVVKIVRTGTAALIVKDGASLTLNDVSFSVGTSRAVEVRAGGVLYLGANVDFSMPSSVAAVLVAQADGFVMTDKLTSAFTLTCVEAGAVGGTFGSATCSQADAEACASLIANGMQGDGTIRGQVQVADDGTLALVWAEGLDVPIEAAAGYYVDKDGKKIAGASLDGLFKKVVAAQKEGTAGTPCEIVIRDCIGLSLKRTTTLSGDVTIRGESDDIMIDELSAGAGFVVPPGVKLTVKDLAFDGSDGYDGNSLFLVNGGALTVENVAFANLTGTNSCSPAVAVLSGSASVSNSAFVSCTAGSGKVTTYGGGGLFVNDGASLALADTTVIGCSAMTSGGGVYAAAGAAVSLAGEIVITNNVSGSASEDLGLSRDNLCLIESSSTKKSSATLSLASTVSGKVSVLWRKTLGESEFAAADGVFATAASADVALDSAAAFANNADTSLAANADGASLVWVAAEAATKQVTPGNAAVSLTPESGEVRYYATIEDAVAEIADDDGAVILDVLKDTAVSNKVAISSAVTLRSKSGTRTVGRVEAGRYSKGYFVIEDGGSLCVTNVTLDGVEAPAVFLNVQSGGSLILQSGTMVTNVTGSASYNEGAIYVNGGTFTMESGVLITDCANDGMTMTDGGSCVGGAIRARNNSTVYLKGGVIELCRAYMGGGGVAVTEKSTVYVSGDLTIVRNMNRSTWSWDNLLVSDNSTLYLAGKLTGQVGVRPGSASDTNVFGRVAAGVSLSEADLASSAANFLNDETDDVGFAVKSAAGEYLLVWSNAFDADGNFTVDGTTYSIVETETPAFAAVTNVGLSPTYTGAPQTCVYEGYGYVLDCTPQTTCGVYTATATLKKNFTWADGSTAAKTIDWQIVKARYDTSALKFEDKTGLADGTSYSITLADETLLPAGVTVEYEGNPRTAAGTYIITAMFSGDSDNYEEIPNMTATLTITAPGPADTEDESKGDTPTPTPSVTTNTPTPIAFQAITKVSEENGQTTWQLVVTNRVPWCHYRLIFTDDLSKGFTTTGAWEQVGKDADAVWTTNVTTTTGAAFWKAEGKEGEVGE